MDFTPLTLAELSSAEVAFATCALPSMFHSNVLIISFKGEAATTHESIGTFAFMRAMIAAGVAAWQPIAVVLDLRQLIYEWGDNMLEVLDAGESIPTSVVVSELNREGLASLIDRESPSKPRELLFDSIEEAVVAVDRSVLANLDPRYLGGVRGLFCPKDPD